MCFCIIFLENIYFQWEKLNFMNKEGCIFVFLLGFLMFSFCENVIIDHYLLNWIFYGFILLYFPLFSLLFDKVRIMRGIGFLNSIMIGYKIYFFNLINPMDFVEKA